MGLRHAIRTASPGALRIAIALARRAYRDALSQPHFTPPPPPRGAQFPHRVVEIVQEIRRSAFFEGKRANLARGSARLDGVVLAPGETLSFWRLVGRPSAAAGFEIGRSIRGGVAGGDVGGGLCQLSGIAYEAGLRAGLAPAERHPHSRDIYAEEDRFTPLGLDATVVWPYKDMRLTNRLPAPVQFRLAVEGCTLIASVHAPTPIEPLALAISRTDRAAWRDVCVTRTRADGTIAPISHDRYAAPLIPNSAPA